MRPKLQEGAEIRKSEEETGNERVLEENGGEGESTSLEVASVETV